MKKNYFAIMLLLSAITLPTFAGDAVFSNSDTESFSIQPMNYASAPSSLTRDNGKSTTAKTVTTTSTNSGLANKNYTSAISNLDSAEVELRQQIANYSSLMAQAKTAYEAKKDEYNSYKREYNELRKKLSNVEKSKKLIQGNYQVNN